MAALTLSLLQRVDYVADVQQDSYVELLISTWSVELPFFSFSSINFLGGSYLFVCLLLFVMPCMTQWGTYNVHTYGSNHLHHKYSSLLCIPAWDFWTFNFLMDILLSSSCALCFVLFRNGSSFWFWFVPLPGNIKLLWISYWTPFDQHIPFSILEMIHLLIILLVQSN